MLWPHHWPGASRCSLEWLLALSELELLFPVVTLVLALCLSQAGVTES